MGTMERDDDRIFLIDQVVQTCIYDGGDIPVQ